MESCEVCGKQQPSCWPVMVNERIYQLCNGCAVLDAESAWAMELIEGTEPRD